MKKGIVKKQKGITLIALVVTIVVLLILAAVSISMLGGENGIIRQAQEAKDKTEAAEEKEKVEISALAARSKEKWGELLESNLRSELDNNIGNGNYTLTVDGEEFIVTFKDSNRSYTIDQDCLISETELKFPEEQPEVGTETFARGYGVIEVEFLRGTSYNTTNTPNEPKMTSDMKAVYWENGEEKVEGEAADFDKNKWYKYTEQTAETTSGGTSKWANAKTSDGSYWVWIPRYAYRIVYFDTEEHTEAYRADNTQTTGIIGYSDARGIIDINGKAVPNISDSKTGIAVNDKKMRTHPVFETDIEQGGWDSKLTGIWVAKYEMSAEASSDEITWSSNDPSVATLLTTNAGNTSATKYRAVSKPNVNSWRYLYVGTMYTNAFYYDRTKESHLMKNSEWGAVAYLTDSKYGRNGTEITINNSSSYITGNAGNEISATSASGVINAYNTTKGMLASTTGNIYGVYDMSGGAREYVAAFNSAGESNLIASYGSSFASVGGTSTKYATEYSNSSSTYKDDFTLGKVSMVGDSIQEIYISNNTGWNQDYVDFVSSECPFLTRGGFCSDGTGAGVFDSYSVSGYYNVDYGFRVVLVP